jgi:hypothetical protein
MIVAGRPHRVSNPTLRGHAGILVLLLTTLPD